MTAPRARRPDHEKQIDAITAKLPGLDAAIAAAQGALDAALVSGSDSRAYRGHLRMSIQARKKADNALAAIEAAQEAERQAAIIAAARAIEQKSRTAREKLLGKFSFSLELPA